MPARTKERYAAPPADTMFSREYYYHLLGPLKGKRLLEIACGEGRDACIAAYNGAEVFAYDLSPAAVDLTRRRAESNGLSSRVQLQVCGDLAAAFAGEQFDAVVGYAALHHLCLDGLGETIHSRLKAGGVAVFAEPVVNSRTLDFLRRLIPYRPVEITEDERPLNDRQIAELAKPFAAIQRREFECIARLYPVFSTHRMIVRALFRLDRVLMRVKAFRRFASVVVFALYRGQ
jgi:SAM-dependent methyltransferase